MAANLSYWPLGAKKETLHLGVVGSFTEGANEVDEFVTLAVAAVPFEGYDHFGAHMAGEAVGEELLHGKVILDIATL